jgi:type II secretory pathway predicted ATPase ExeA
MDNINYDAGAALDEPAKQEQVVNATIDRIVAFENNIISHDKLEKAEDAIRKLQSRYRPPGQPQLKARALLLVGESGSGKSTVLESYFDKNRPKTVAESETEDGDIRPVVVVEVPQRPGRRQFVAAIMGELGYKVKDDWDTNEIIRKISYYCRELQVQVLLIDEAHHIVEGKKQDAEEDISEFIKSLLNRCRVQIVLAGLPSLLQLRSYKQLNRRFQPPVQLRPYNWSTLEGRGEFLIVLTDFETNAGLPKPSKLADHEIAKRIYCATGGHIGLVSKYLSEALERAIDQDKEVIDLELLAEVYAAFEGEVADKLLRDFDAAPKKGKTERERRASNPFLATNAELKVLWKAMMDNQDEMVKAAKRRNSRETRFKGTRGEPKVFS